MQMENNPESVRPRLQLLTPEQMNAVHQYSTKILETTGIKVESKTALGIFKKSDAAKVSNDVVTIQRELVNHAIEVAPSSIAIHDKAGDVAFHLGEQQGDETFFGIGVTNTYFQAIEGGQVEPFTREHMQHSAKLGDLLGNYDMVSTLGIPSDAAADKLDLYATLDMYANTSKPLVLLILDGLNVNKVFDMLSFLHGDISSKPFCIPYLNPITPLVLNASTTDKMIAAIHAQLPIMYSNYSMYGGSSPVTEGGSLALLNAELLAGLVFSQLIKEGSKMILGSLPAAFNMKTMGSHYTPASYLLNLACAEMMRFYGLPHCGTSGSGNGWGEDLLASGDLWMNHLTSCIGKIGCAPFVGGNFDSMAFSPSTVILSHHIIGEARKFARGFVLNDETVDTAGIAAVGHGGDYLTSEQTLASLSQLRKEDPVWPSLSLESWRQQGKPEAKTFLLDYTKEIYAKAIRESTLNADVVERGERYIETGS